MIFLTSAALSIVARNYIAVVRGDWDYSLHVARIGSLFFILFSLNLAPRSDNQSPLFSFFLFFLFRGGFFTCGLACLPASHRGRLLRVCRALASLCMRVFEREDCLDSFP